MLFNTTFSNITVMKISVPIPTLTSGTLTFNGTSQSPTWDYDATLVRLVSGNSGVNAGTYYAEFQLIDTEKYMWEDKAQANKQIEWVINRAVISTVPSQSGSLTYTGNVQSATWTNYDSSKMNVSGTTSAIDAGTYTIEFTPNSNYKWSDGSTGTKYVQWRIGKKTISAIPSQSGTLTYNGTELEPSWNNYNPLELDISGYTNGINAGEYTAVFTPNKNCTWAGELEIVDLPEGYTQVEYIENPNGAYINIPTLGLYEKANFETKIRMLSDSTALFRYTYRTYTQYSGVVNSYTPNNNSLAISTTDGVRSVNLSSYDNSSFSSAEQAATSVSAGAVDDITIKINGSVSSGSTTEPTDVTVIANTNSKVRSKCRVITEVPLFGFHDIFYYNVNSDTSPSYDEVSVTYNFRLYYLKMYTRSTGAVTANYVPCIAPDGKVGLYNTISKAFYGSENSANFSAGPIAVEEDNNSPVSVTWTIGQASVSVVPSQDGTLVYDGSVVSPVWKNYDSSMLDIGGETSGVNARSYEATFTPNANCKWWDGTTTSKSATWVIAKADVSITANPDSLYLDLDNMVGEIVVTRDSTGEITAESSDTSVATVEVDGNVVRVTGMYTGDIKIAISVASDGNYNAGSIQVPVESKVPRMYTVTADIEPDGKGSIDGLGVYAEGTEVTLTANPADEWKFSGWIATKSRLPAGYKELEYIEVNNRTRIDTGFRITNPLQTKISMDITPLEKVSAYRYLFVAINTASYYSIPAIMLRQNNASNQMYWFFGDNANTSASGQYGTFTYNMAANTRIAVDVDYASKKIQMGSSSFTISPVSTMAGANCGYLFIGNTSAVTDVVDSYTLHMNLYSFQVYENNELVCDMIPCKDKEGVAGMYDMVSGVFKTVYLTGSLADAGAGPEIPEETEMISTSTTLNFVIESDVHVTALFKEIVPEYIITATVNPEGSGVVMGTGIYEEDTEVTLEAVAEEGYQFENWSEDWVEEQLSTENPYVFKAARDLELVANFTEKKSRLPEGYTEVEYISNPNLGYIPDIGLTGTKPFDSKKMEITIQITDTPPSTKGYIFGAYCAYKRSSTATQVYSYHALTYNSSNKTIVNEGTGNVSISDILDDILNITLDYETLLLSVNEKTPVTIKSSDAFAKSVPVSLFSLHSMTYLASSVQSDKYTGLSYFNFFSMKISSGGEVLNEWVPCINPDGLVGIYDLITGDFQSSGDETKPLVAGPAV